MKPAQLISSSAFGVIVGMIATYLCMATALKSCQIETRKFETIARDYEEVAARANQRNGELRNEVERLKR